MACAQAIMRASDKYKDNFSRQTLDPGWKLGQETGNPPLVDFSPNIYLLNFAERYDAKSRSYTEASAVMYILISSFD